MSLLKQRRFLPYFVTQFLGAFNDNVFKNGLVIIFTYQLAVADANSGGSILLNIAALVFILPFFIFSPIAGQIADKFEKSGLIRKIKWFEIFIMALGCVGLYLQSSYFLLVVLFLMGMQSAFFGPIKYSILPQHLAKKDLLGANALVEGGTFLAILLGTILGGILAATNRYSFWVSCAILLFAILGRIASQAIPAAPAAQANLIVDKHPIRSAKSLFSDLRANQNNFLTALGIAWFWFVGATFLTQFPSLARELLKGDAYVATILMAMFSIGIALGSYLCVKLSNGRVNIGIVPIGAFGLTLFGLLAGTVDIINPSFTEGAIKGDTISASDLFQRWDTLKLLLSLLGLAVSGGVFVVPLYSYLQTNSPDEYRSRNIAASNMLDALFMVFAATFAIILFKFGHSIQSLYVIIALMNIAVALFIFVRAPEFILRAGAWLLVHSLYRIGKHDLDNIPKEGPALLISNHVSFVDPIILGALVERPVRFVMHHKIYDLPVANYLFKAAKAIPIASARADKVLLEKAYNDIADTLNDGELVCIFPEGGLTPDGEIQAFKRGAEKILKRTPVPVVPMAVRGLWGTWFSRKGGRAMKGFPRNWMKKIDVLSGELIQSENANLENLQKRVEELRGSHP